MDNTDASKLLMKVDTNIKLESVILSDENKEKISNFLNEIEHRKLFTEYGLHPMNKLLFYGASGTGKTLLAKALSNTMNYKMLYIDIARALSNASVAINMVNIFELAEKLKNCIIFLDECDSITMSRYNSDYNDTAEVRRATDSLFQLLDQMSTENVFIAATNLLFKIDPAFERRMDLKLEFKRPNMNIKDVINFFLLPKFTCKDDVDPTIENIVSRRARENSKLSYYELQVLVERAMKRALINGTNIVHTSDIYNDLAISMKVKILFGTQDDPKEIFDRPKDNY